jgi:hypothetical protein
MKKIVWTSFLLFGLLISPTYADGVEDITAYKNSSLQAMMIGI